MENKSIYILTDYKGFFGSKQLSSIYRGGFDMVKLISLFNEHGFEVKVCGFSEVGYKEIEKDSIILYTSSEDNDDHYKSFIDDVIYHLDRNGYFLIPKYSYLKAHNNKVAMELLRTRSNKPELNTISSRVFGTLDELKQNIQEITYPVVIKTYVGAMSRGVARADDRAGLLHEAEKLSRSFHLRHDVKEYLRKIKYRNKYVIESFHRSKFITQNLIEGLQNDWKVLVYGNRCYALYRGNRENDFRASGSGKFIFRTDLPSGMLDFAFHIKEHFNVPHISLDIGFDGTKFHLIEFQFISFGTTTIEKSPHYFHYVNGSWRLIEEKSDLEKVYVESIVNYLDRSN